MLGKRLFQRTRRLISYQRTSQRALLGSFAARVAAPGVDPSLVVPGATELIDKTSYDAMRAFRSPFVEVHELGFYALAVVIVLHLIAVVVTEIHEGGSITSAMFTGRKILSRPPPDAP
jgi:Ni/Fe-hydrogenase 1 B-type cytochrome subunit